MERLLFESALADEAFSQVETIVQRSFARAVGITRKKLEMHFLSAVLRHLIEHSLLRVNEGSQL